ncbi:shikimate dehydrogenase [Maledivibacter halophilus]|uniref:Shikimate dehydrogenase (NADP(+)) n=1 Tax=Maledivibacter halophilus TaxID=36842 RepID=A0A1T5LZ91_9FIRM|nr:shikimate dehydrogenase [Maledivibacter halophilus]SKC81301.1 shikimate dehydrogenase [Maledivibacter halophilus]
MSNLFGLIGEKLKHSFSPAIHSIIFNELNIEGYYDLFEVKSQDLKMAIYGLKAIGARGVNVTIPYKVNIMEYLDDLSHEAKKIGAVNTICFKENKTIGYNTDYFGFGIMLDKYDIDIKNKEAVILGTGGASKAVLQYLLDKGIRDIIFVSRNIRKSKERLKNYKVISYDDFKKISDKDMIINCTPSGMYPKVENCPVSRDDISKFQAAVDLIYNPVETLFLKHAKDQGIKSVNGLYMLVGQAVKAQELWNDIEISSEVIEKIYEEIKKLR